MPAASESFDAILARLHPDHAAVLEWFAEHEGDVGPRPTLTRTGLRLLDPASGIWKPRYTPFAVAVAQGVKKRYPDEDPVFWPDGSWTYLYHQQGYDFGDPRSLATNRGLWNCMAEGIPVGVVIPAAKSNKPIYRVMGLAQVLDWKRGHFILGGPVRPAATDGLFLPEGLLSGSLAGAGIASEFRVEDLTDDRRKVLRAVVQRQGQPAFRKTLLKAYSGRCAITRYDAPDALEAAHILAYRGTESHHPANGILLRADLHNLFDVGLIAVDTSQMTLVAGPEVSGTKYERLVGSRLLVPSDPKAAPSVEALDRHRHLAGI